MRVGSSDGVSGSGRPPPRAGCDPDAVTDTNSVTNADPRTGTTCGRDPAGAVLHAGPDARSNGSADAHLGAERVTVAASDGGADADSVPGRFGNVRADSDDGSAPGAERLAVAVSRAFAYANAPAA